MARITDIQDNKIRWETVPYCSISKENLPKYIIIRRCDIYLARQFELMGVKVINTTDAMSISRNTGKG